MILLVMMTNMEINEPTEEPIKTPEEKKGEPQGVVPFQDTLRVRKLYDANWDEIGGVTNSKARVYLTNDQTLESVSQDVVGLDAETYDVNNEFASNKFTVKVAGYYQINGQVKWLSTEADKQYTVYISKNGSIVAYASLESSHVTSITTVISDIVLLAIGDYIQLEAQHNGASSIDIAGGTTTTFLSIHKLS